VPDDLSQTLRRWELGGALRQIREDRKKTIEQVAQDLGVLYGAGFSAAKIGRLETGRRGANPRDVRDLCDYYQVEQVERDRLVAMAKDVRLDNRLQGTPATYAEFVALESVASTECTFEPMLVPGLLQTTDYYLAMRDGFALAGLRPEENDDEPLPALMEIRRQRQLRLAGENLLYLRAIIDENVVRRCVGSREIMMAQLEHLIEMSYKPNITLRVIPTSFGIYPGCQSSGFALLEYDHSHGKPVREEVCYVEGFVKALWAENIAARLRVAHVFSCLESIALNADESRATIAAAQHGFA